MKLSPISHLLIFAAAVLIAGPTIGKAETNSLEKPRIEGDTAWFDAKLLEIEGQGWTDTKSPYDRLPAKAEGKVRDAVWSLSRHSTGLVVRFSTDASSIRAAWTLTSDRLAMPHMPATGVSGLDLYVHHEGKWRWLANGRPAKQSNRVNLVSGIPAAKRDYLLYLPLYNGVTSVEIGIPKTAHMMKSPPRAANRRAPIVFYGTSITQGGCASRPGMVHTALLGRWLDHPVINLGFSGNGRMEREVAELMAELNAAAFVIDCLPNIAAPDVKARTEPLVKTLREAHPNVPILLVEDRNYTNSFLIASKRSRNESSQATLRTIFEKLSANDDNLHYLRGADLLGDDSEGTVDSSHPTDLGFFRQAEVFAKALRPLLDDH